MPRGKPNSTLSPEIIQGCEQIWLSGVTHPDEALLDEFHEEMDVTGDAKTILAIKKWWETTRHRAFKGKLKRDLEGATAANVRAQRAAANNTVAAVPGNNTVAAVPSNNTVAAVPGNNTVAAVPGNNTVVAVLGNNIVAASPEENAVSAGPEENTVVAVPEKRKVTMVTPDTEDEFIPEVKKTVDKI